ncbi:hypothetical protein ABK040_011546 [Willaertia magna]
MNSSYVVNSTTSQYYMFYNNKTVILEALDTLPINILSIVNTVGFSLFYIAMIIFIFIFLHRNKDVKKNQKIILSLVAFLLIIQTLGMTSRGIYDIINIVIISQYSSEVPFQLIIPLYVFASFEAFFIFANLIVIFIIMAFVALVFIDTVYAAGMKLSKKQHEMITFLVSLTAFIFSIITFLIVLVTAITYVLTKIKIVEDFKTYLYIPEFIIYVFMVLFLTVIVNIIAINLLITIRKNALPENKSASQKPFIKTLILTIVMTCTALLQIVAAGFSVGMFSLPPLKIVYYFVNALSIFLFALVTLLLYHPLFIDIIEQLRENKMLETKKLETKEMVTIESIDNLKKNSSRSSTSSEQELEKLEKV